MKINKYKLILVLILIIGFAMRIWGLNFGFPLELHPDEAVNYNPALKIASTGDLNPHTFIRPDQIPIYLNSLSYFLVTKFYNVTHASTLTPLELSKTNLTLFIYLGRLLTLSFGLLGIYAVYLLGKESVNIQVGLIAAFLLSILPLHVVHSHYMTPDIPLTTFLTFVMYFLIKFLNTDNLKYLIFSSIFAGLAIATKYPGAIVLPVIYLGLFFSKVFRQVKILDKFLLLLLPVLVIIISFFVSTPYILKEMSLAIKEFKNEARSEHLGLKQLSYGEKLGFYINEIINKANGTFFLLSIISGLFILAISKFSYAKVLIIFTLTFLLLISRLGLYWERWLEPLSPFIVIYSSFTIYSFYDKVKNYKLRVFLTLILTVLIVIPLLLRTILRNNVINAKSTIILESDWWDKRKIDPKKSGEILADNYSARNPVTNKENLSNQLKIKSCSEIILENKYVVLSSFMFRRIINSADKFPQEASCYKTILKRKPLIIFQEKHDVWPDMTNDFKLLMTINYVFNIFHPIISGPRILVYKFY